MSTVVEIIQREAAQRGALPFARFMELALYCPVHGYYETEKDNPGRQGDFYTSVGVGSLFGELLAAQFSSWLMETPARKLPARIAEAGAHDGKLAEDVLNWIHQNHPGLLDSIEYWIIEPSGRRQHSQRERLKPFQPRVRWFADFKSAAEICPAIEGIIFSNELLDAMPVHRFGWDAKARSWFEWGVTVKGEKFVWTKISPAPSEPGCRIGMPHELETILPDGYIIETSPAAEQWWTEAAGILQRGRLLTVDYGLTANDLFSPHRLKGTLRAYHRHHVTDDVLGNAGAQDITAHVNFDAIQTAGEKAGLATEVFCTQAQFLTGILAHLSRGNQPMDWTPARTRQFQTLTHPEHLGRAFRVLVQKR